MSTWPASVGLIGCGAMGTAMLTGLLREERLRSGAIIVSDTVGAAADAAAAETGATTGTPADAAACDLVILAVKPKDAPEALAALAAHAPSQSVVLSVVAGWDIDRLAAAAPGISAIVRTMPNLAVRHGAGVVTVATRGVSHERQEALHAALAPLGTVVELPEALIGPSTAIVGSGPGFVALVAEGLEEGAVAIGFSRDQARRMVHAVLAGTATLLADGSDPAELRQRVSSPAGTTIEGVGVLERGGVRAHMADAVRAAARRAAEL